MIIKRGKHLTNDSKIRLIKHTSSLEKELDDYKNFKPLTWNECSDDRDKRRNVERWIENIVTSSVDIAKLVLVSEKKQFQILIKKCCYHFRWFLVLIKRIRKKFHNG